MEFRGQLALHAEVPLLHVWRLIAGEHAAVAPADVQAHERRGPSDLSGGRLKPSGKGLSMVRSGVRLLSTLTIMSV